MRGIRYLQIPFSELNDKCKYIILRNFEGFYDDILIEGHNDIDVLVASKKDARIMVNIFSALPRPSSDDGIHYKFLYRDQYVDLDIRTAGDGYYDKKWEKDMLDNRLLDYRGFYVNGGAIDYFYSLVYHAIYQKDFLSDDYIFRFKTMNVLAPSECEEEKLKKHLNNYMVERDYYYTVPFDRSCMHRYEGEWVEKRLKYPIGIRFRHNILKRKRIKTLIANTAKALLGEENYNRLKTRIRQ